MERGRERACPTSGLFALTIFFLLAYVEAEVERGSKRGQYVTVSGREDWEEWKDEIR